MTHSTSCNLPSPRSVVRRLACSAQPIALLLGLTSTSLAEPAAAPTDAPKPPPYSLPFQLRPAAVATVVRSDTALAFYENPADGESGSTVASMLLGAYKLSDQFAPLVRLGVVSNSPPESPMAPDSAVGLLNPVLGATYAPKIAPELKLAFFLAVALPLGSGGGNDAGLENRVANAMGIRARSAMDNAMFAVNDFVVFPGVGLAFVSSGFTAQVEATVLQLTRVKGEDLQTDESKTNLTGGLHLGYFIVPMLSAAVELRHQRWLSSPDIIAADDALRDTSTVEVGPRLHVKIGETMWFRPAVGLILPIDDPMADAKYKIVHLDLPLSF